MAQLKTPQETEDIKRPGKPPFSVSAPGGILCSNYGAEVLALLNATEAIISWEEKSMKAVFLADSLSALQALMSGEPDTTQKKLTENISTLAQTTFVVLQWIPAHTGIRENEIADQLAKGGREKKQPPRHLFYREVKTLIRNKKKIKKPSSTARLEDTTQNRTHSISCHDTNRPPSLAPEQATAD